MAMTSTESKSLHAGTCKPYIVSGKRQNRIIDQVHVTVPHTETENQQLHGFIVHKELNTDAKQQFF